ncbi:hypothetical protein GCM10023169_20480 [Georgenia halophila]|uniref:Uncharacterized protein n=1 Tax=Georgenia halophila TaxID=620889 RepID=A0ABP8L7M0_9MICO
MRFRGFDFNDRLEGRLADYARYLIERDMWEDMAKYFDDEHERGNSHVPMYETYTRMLGEFQPLWRRRVENMTKMTQDQFALSVEEMRAILAARVNPSNRR